MEIAKTCSQLEQLLGQKDINDIGFVPTMGALHSGHMSLVSRARLDTNTLIVSIFVNPTQFNDPSDLKNYPRTESEDLKLLETAGVDIVFMPTVEQIYPEPDTRIFDFKQIDKVMEGATRPGHFNGVAQIVSRLFDLVKPKRAYFGQKDFQQIAVIREMVRQLNLTVEIVACPIVRDYDGLALSSRNVLLTEAHRDAAPNIYEALVQGVELMGMMSPDDVVESVVNQINNEPLLKVIYFDIVNSATLARVNSWQEEGAKQGCIAVQAGSVRLIDNIIFVE